MENIIRQRRKELGLSQEGLAEKLSVMAKILAAGKYEKEELTRAWKVVLFNQFHDILAGASLEEGSALPDRSTSLK